MKPNNPFLISGYHSPEFFCDRVSETNNILNALYNGRNVTLIAPRRMGKTGLIRHAFYHSKLQNSEITTLYIPTPASIAHVSSSGVRTIVNTGGDFSPYISEKGKEFFNKALAKNK